MSELKYEVGDKVLIKDIDWYNKNKDEYGDVNCPPCMFVWVMCQYCGKILTINSVDDFDKKYKMTEDAGRFNWTDEMIECKVEEGTKPKFKVGDIVYSKTWQRDVIIQEILPDGLYKVGDLQGLGWFKENEDNLLKEKITLPTDSHLTKPFKHEISLLEEHQFVDENGNVINSHKIVLEKKKNEYPKTFLACCDVLNIGNLIERGVKGYKAELFDTLQKLYICRDAYWQIAGEKMGLNKSWEPDWNTSEPKYVISCTSNGIEKQWETTYCKVLAFPTEEMRDAFYENFKELIEICKELL